VAGSIVSMQLPFLHEQPTFRYRLAPGSYSFGNDRRRWRGRAIGSAAIDVPALGVTRSWHNSVVPIASLTKLMTAYVVLKKFPLAHRPNRSVHHRERRQVLDYEQGQTADESAVIVEERRTTV
jgi:hypothetical protein